MLKIIFSLVALVAAAGVLFFRFVGLPPKIDAAPHVSIGETLAEHAVKSIGPGGKIVLIAPDPSAFRYPGFEIQLKAFHRALQKSHLIVAATNLIKLDPLYLVRTPSGDFANILRKQADTDVIVSLLGPPILTSEQRMKVPQRHARVLAVCSGDLPRFVNLKAMFEDELLHMAIVSRAAPPISKPQGSNPQTWFKQYYEVITASNTADLPPVVRAANP